MKRFRVERKTGDLGIMIVTLYNPPYEDKDILHKKSWKAEDVIITEIQAYEEIDE